jgi:putative heme iron utilization protein
MLSKHGHEAGKDPRASIIQSTQESIDNLKKRIKDELKESQNNIIINHNFRTD